MTNKMEAYYPKKLGNILVTSGLIIYIVSTLLRKLTDNFDVIWISNLLGFLGLVLASSSLIIFGIRAVRYYGVSKKQIITPILGIIICVGMVGLNGYLYQVMGEVEKISVGEDKIVELKDRIDSGALPADKKAYASELYASRMYTAFGIIEKHITTDGKLVEFRPSAEDEESRNLVIELKNVIKHNRDNNIYSIYIWLGTLLISLTIGLRSSIHKEDSGIDDK
ncbi:MAG: hypothetical protein Q9N62_11490 [Ghiorsea sp.]|nr:hypothetical protein [Ghiorsea sp.]